MSDTISVRELKEQIKKIHKTADFLRKRTIEMNDDKETQEYTKAYATGMEKAVSMMEEYLNNK